MSVTRHRRPRRWQATCTAFVALALVACEQQAPHARGAELEDDFQVASRQSDLGQTSRLVEALEQLDPNDMTSADWRTHLPALYGLEPEIQDVLTAQIRDLHGAAPIALSLMAARAGQRAAVASIRQYLTSRSYRQRDQSLLSFAEPALLRSLGLLGSEEDISLLLAIFEDTDRKPVERRLALAAAAMVATRAGSPSPAILDRLRSAHGPRSAPASSCGAWARIPLDGYDLGQTPAEAPPGILGIPSQSWGWIAGEHESSSLVFVDARLGHDLDLWWASNVVGGKPAAARFAVSGEDLAERGWPDRRPLCGRQAGDEVELWGCEQSDQGSVTFSPRASLADEDADGLSVLEERRFGTNPRVADTDGDGVADGVDCEPLSKGVPEWPARRPVAAILEYYFRAPEEGGADRLLTLVEGAGIGPVGATDRVTIPAPGDLDSGLELTATRPGARVREAVVSVTRAPEPNASLHRHECVGDEGAERWFLQWSGGGLWSRGYYVYVREVAGRWHVVGECWVTI